MLLREVRLDDVESYVRMLCDPVMMAELGGPLPRDRVEETVRRHVRENRSGAALACLIVSEGDPMTVAGTVSAAERELDGEQLAEIGWAVLPEFQGRGLATGAVRLLLARLRAERPWPSVHAFPGIANVPSNAVCRSTGFTLLGQREIEYAGRLLPANHWRFDLVAPGDAGGGSAQRMTRAH